ncbi:hypothetical protein, partial [Rhodothermus marinus]|uniref:Uncharacterized protein n=1 Tax=Rhodothermus marinus (strain ATCC 43812 / DSM 4252 / R-10) TaxID=518766 RepID=D0MKU2_RHOM4
MSTRVVEVAPVRIGEPLRLLLLSRVPARALQGHLFVEPYERSGALMHAVDALNRR